MDWISLFINLLPLLGLAAFWVHFSKRAPDKRSMAKFQTEYLIEMGKSNEFYGRIAVALEKIAADKKL